MILYYNWQSSNSKLSPNVTNDELALSYTFIAFLMGGMVTMYLTHHRHRTVVSGPQKALTAIRNLVALGLFRSNKTPVRVFDEPSTSPPIMTGDPAESKC
jgi:hypothetical protein